MSTTWVLIVVLTQLPDGMSPVTSFTQKFSHRRTPRSTSSN